MRQQDSAKVAGLASDNPIQEAQRDRLQRDALAERFARNVLSLDASEGLVVGVLGPWGSGKTSVLNLMRPHLKALGATIVDFNPWMFSGADQLVAAFFSEVSHELKIRPGLRDVGEAVGAYGETIGGLSWLPVVGPAVGGVKGVAKAVQMVASRSGDRMGWKREQILKALDSVEGPIVVMLDDIDRLSRDEVRDIFKLVRLTASFPSIVYVVSFDRARVESALTDGDIRGRDYLEKIIQLALELPVVRAETLRKETFEALTAATSGAAWVDDADEKSWPDKYFGIVEPLIKNMRDVRRYALAVAASVTIFDGRLALGDVLALEAVRVFMPDTFAMLPGRVEVLTATSDWNSQNGSAGAGLVESLVASGGQDSDIAKRFVTTLFPAAGRHIGGSNYGSDWIRVWRRERRVCIEDNLRFYLEQIEGDSLVATGLASRAFAVLADPVALRSVLDPLEPEQKVDVIQSLLDYRDDFKREQVVSGVVYLAEALPSLPRVRPGFFTPSSDAIVSVVVRALLDAAGGGESAVSVVHEALRAIESLSGRLIVLDAATKSSNQEEGLIGADESAEVWRSWQDAVRLATTDALTREPDLMRVVWFAMRGPEAEPTWDPPRTPQFNAAWLLAAVSVSKSTQMGSHVVRLNTRILWDDLVELLGDETALLERLESARAAMRAKDSEVLDLYDRYAAGERPD